MVASYQLDQPLAGTYAVRLCRGGPRVACRVWFGAAVIEGEEQDRSWAWRVEVDGRTDQIERGDDGYLCHVAIPLDRVWPYCANEPIDQAEYAYLRSVAAWAREHDPSHPAANPRRPIVLSTTKPSF